MTETDLVTVSAEMLCKRFPLMKLSEAVRTSWEIVKEFRKENGEPDEKAIEKITREICGEQIDD